MCIHVYYKITYIEFTQFMTWIIIIYCGFKNLFKWVLLMLVNKQLELAHVHHITIGICQFGTLCHYYVFDC